MMKTRRTLSVRSAVAVVTIVGFVLPVVGPLQTAGADSRTIEDERDDTQAVDLISVSHGHSDSLEHVMVHTFGMAEPWEDEDLLGGTIKIWVPDGDRQVDTEVILGFNPDRSMYALIRDEETGTYRGHGNVWMQDDRTIRVEFVQELATGHFSKYRWRAQITFVCQEEGVVCAAQRDQAPNEGKVLHEL